MSRSRHLAGQLPCNLYAFKCEEEEMEEEGEARTLAGTHVYLLVYLLICASPSKKEQAHLYAPVKGAARHAAPQLVGCGHALYTTTLHYVKAVRWIRLYTTLELLAVSSTLLYCRVVRCTWGAYRRARKKAKAQASLAQVKAHAALPQTARSLAPCSYCKLCTVYCRRPLDGERRGLV